MMMIIMMAMMMFFVTMMITYCQKWKGPTGYGWVPKKAGRRAPQNFLFDDKKLTWEGTQSGGTFEVDLAWQSWGPPVGNGDDDVT